jgi:hypothetical protein
VNCNAERFVLLQNTRPGEFRLGYVAGNCHP